MLVEVCGGGHVPVEALMRCGVFRTVMHSCGTCLHQSVRFLLMVQTAGVFYFV